MAAGDYTALELMRAMRAAGFVYGKGLIVGFAVSTGENTARDLTAVFVNTDGSRDRGPWQENDKFHAEISDACAFNLACSTKEALRLSNNGAGFTAWSAFNNGRYQQFMELGYTVYALDNALQQVDALTAKVGSLTSANKTLQTQLDAANAQATKLQAQVVSIQAALDAANTEVASLTTANALLEADLTSANADKAALQTELDALRAAAEDARSILAGDAAVSAKATLDAVL